MATFYVGTSGDDAADGSILNPWATVAHAAGAVSPDDVICLRGGTFLENVTVPQAGLPGAPIAIQAHLAEPVLWDGGLAAALTANAANRGYWTIKGISFRCAGDVREGARAINHNYWIPDNGSWTAGDVPGWRVEDCVFNCGIRLTGANPVVRNNLFDGAGNPEAKNLVWIAYQVSTDALVETNVVRNGKGRGIWLNTGTHRAIVRKNAVSDMVMNDGKNAMGIDIDGYSGLIEGPLVVEDNVVAESEALGILFESCIGGASVKRNRVSGTLNGALVFNNYAPHGTQPDTRGLHLDAIVRDNLIHDCAGGYLRVHSVAGISYINNTLADGRGDNHQGLWLGGENQHLSDIAFRDNIMSGLRMAISVPTDWITLAEHDHNCYHSAYANCFERRSDWTYSNFEQFRTATGQEQHSITDDPLFVGGGDYQVQDGSLCKPIGVYDWTEEDMTAVTDLQAIEVALRQQAIELVTQADAVAQVVLDLQALDDTLDAAADVIDADV